MFNNPSIIYFKDNTQAKKMTVNLNDILFMFRLNEDISNVFGIELEGNLNYENGTQKQIRFEKCELGKNIDENQYYKENCYDESKSKKVSALITYTSNDNHTHSYILTDNSFTINVSPK